MNLNRKVSIMLFKKKKKRGRWFVGGGGVKTRVATFRDNGFLESHPGIIAFNTDTRGQTTPDCNYK